MSDQPLYLRIRAAAGHYEDKVGTAPAFLSLTPELWAALRAEVEAMVVRPLDLLIDWNELTFDGIQIVLHTEEEQDNLATQSAPEDEA
jgi:hypothetical protein